MKPEKKMSAAKKGNNNAKGHKHSEESKAKISGRQQGANNSNFKGKVYLYVVHSHRLELASTHLNTQELVDILGVPRSTLYRFIKNRILFKFNGVSYIASRDGNLS